MANAGLYAEEGLLAGILNDPSNLHEIVAEIREEDFQEPKYQQIYAAITELFTEGKGIDLIRVGSKLRDMGQFQNVGGLETLSSLVDPLAPYAADADVTIYAEIVKEESIRRSLYNHAYNIGLMSKVDSGNSVESIMSYSNECITNLSMRLNQGETMSSGAEMLDNVEEIFATRRNSSGIQGVPTGFIDLDKATSGFLPGQFVVIAARPSVGKSTLAVDFLRNSSIKAGLTTLMFSLEMSRNEVMDRIISAEANIRLDSIRKGTLTEEDEQNLHSALPRIKEADFFIDDSPVSTIEYIKSAAIKQQESETGLHLIIVDYLQLMKSGKNIESRQQEVSEFSRSLKILAKELGIPIIALSQLNRGSENRTEKKPKMSDIRESGSIEQDADIIILLHRENSDLPGSEQTLLILAKNRQGETKDIPIAALLAYAKFGNASGEYPPPDEEGGVLDEPPFPVDFEEENPVNDSPPTSNSDGTQGHVPSRRQGSQEQPQVVHAAMPNDNEGEGPPAW